MCRRGGKILEIIGTNPKINATTGKLSYCNSPLSESDMIFDTKPYTKPLEWNLTNKRWMGHD